MSVRQKTTSGIGTHRAPSRPLLSAISTPPFVMFRHHEIHKNNHQTNSHQHSQSQCHRKEFCQPACSSPPPPHVTPARSLPSTANHSQQLQAPAHRHAWHSSNRPLIYTDAALEHSIRCHSTGLRAPAQALPVPPVTRDPSPCLVGMSAHVPIPSPSSPC